LSASTFVTPVFGKSVFDNHQTVFTTSFARILLVRVERLINGPRRFHLRTNALALVRLILAGLRTRWVGSPPVVDAIRHRAVKLKAWPRGGGAWSMDCGWMSADLAAFGVVDDELRLLR
jgi:hypothetical protein